MLPYFVLNHNIRFSFALHLLFLLFFVIFALVSCYFVIFGNLLQNVSRELGNSENPKMKNAENKKTGHFDKSS